MRFLSLVVATILAASALGTTPIDGAVLPTTPRLLLLGATPDMADDVDIALCDPQAQYPVVVHSVALDPNPPRFNQKLKVTVRADFHVDITAGTMAHAEGTVGLIKFNRDIDVCEEAKRSSSRVCPLSKGDDQLIVVEVPLPDVKISVTANLKVNVVNGGDQQTLFCFKARVAIQP